jgi:hypothetical protein
MSQLTLIREEAARSASFRRAIKAGTLTEYEVDRILWAGGACPAGLLRTSRPKTPAWTPASAATIKYWLNPNDSSKVFSDTAGTTPAVSGTAGGLARINDSSGAGLCTGGVIQATSGNRPTWTSSDANCNSKGSIQSPTGGVSSKVLQLAAFAGAVTIPQPWSRVIGVYNSTGTTNNAVFCDSDATESGYMRADASTGNLTVYTGGGGGGGLLTTSVSGAGFHIYVLVGNGASSALRKDGASVTLTGTKGTSAFSGITTGDNYLGPATGISGAIAFDSLYGEDVIGSGLITTIDIWAFALYGVHA